MNAAALELASLLIQHRTALDTDINTLTLTGQTLDRNVGRLVDTTHWAADLFAGAGQAVDFSHDWLRLNNQGEPLAMLILQRLQERLMELCQDLGVPSCSVASYWAVKVPSLFCFQAPCAKAKGSGADQLASALDGIPAVKKQVDQQNGGSGSTDSAVDDLIHRLPGLGGAG